MTVKTKQIILIILIFVLSIVGTIFFKRITIFKTDDALNPIFGILMGSILIGLLQEGTAIGWVYHVRYFLNGIGCGFGLILIGLLDSIIRGDQSHLIKILLIEGAFGLVLGLASGLAVYLTDLGRKKATPYTGTGLPVMTGSASMWYPNHSFSKGRVLLMNDRLLFLAAGSPNQTFLFADILNVDFVHALGFTNRLIFHMKDSESVELGLPMARYWQKKIREALDR